MGIESMGIAEHRADLYLERLTFDNQPLPGVLRHTIGMAHRHSMDRFAQVLWQLAQRVYEGF